MLDLENQQKLLQVIAYLEKTTDEEWLTDLVRSGDGKKNCVLGHIFAMGKNDNEGNQWWNWFEACIATTFMIYPVNDGSDPRYTQKTPKSRILAYLHDVFLGKRQTTHEIEETYYANFSNIS